jgi:hypothetical protein
MSPHTPRDATQLESEFGPVANVTSPIARSVETESSALNQTK